MKITVEFDDAEFLEYVEFRRKRAERAKRELDAIAWQECELAKLGPSVRLERVLRNIGLTTCEQARNYSEIDFLKQPGAGRRTLTELRELLTNER